MRALRRGLRRDQPRCVARIGIVLFSFAGFREVMLTCMRPLSVPARASEGTEAEEEVVENHHTVGGLRERVTMGSHLNDRQVVFPSLFVQFSVPLQLMSLENSGHFLLCG